MVCAAMNPIFDETRKELESIRIESKSLNETSKEMQEKMTALILSRREALVSAWVAETGILPSESVICSGFQGNIFRVFIESKTENDKRVVVAPPQE